MMMVETKERRPRYLGTTVVNIGTYIATICSAWGAYLLFLYGTDETYGKPGSGDLEAAILFITVIVFMPSLLAIALATRFASTMGRWRFKLMLCSVLASIPILLLLIGLPFVTTGILVLAQGIYSLLLSRRAASD